MTEKKEFVVSEAANSTRLDKFLVTVLEETGLSRTKIQALISDQLVLVEGEVTTSPKFLVLSGMTVTISLPIMKPLMIAPEKIDFEIIYQDQDLLVINKPNNLVVHPGVGNQQGTLVNGLLNAISDLSSVGGEERPGIVHRLDKKTTGLIIVAKNNQTHQKLSQMLAQHEIKKEYLALVWGVINEDNGVIEAPIGRHHQDRKKMAVTHTSSRFAKTSFHVLERFSNATLVSCVLETGRTHQIRVHFNFIHHPIMNDPDYGRLHEKITPFGQYLHAYKLTFHHPSTNQRMEFTAPLPPEFNDKIKALREEK